MEYTIQQLSRLSGVTTRALRWYDKLGLLTPSGRTEGGYRRYGPAEEAGKEIADLHRRWLTIMGDKYDVQRHRGIAELYVQDQRFTAYYDKERPGCTQFLRDAVLAWIR